MLGEGFEGGKEEKWIEALIVEELRIWGKKDGSWNFI